MPHELTGYKVPKHVYFRTELPKTNVGKILRRALRDELAAPAQRSLATLAHGVTATVSTSTRDPLGIHIGRDAVAQIEHVPGARAEAVEHPHGLRAQRFGRREQRRRVQIALQRHAAADRPPRRRKIRGPVDADGVAADRRRSSEPRAPALGEYDVRARDARRPRG